MEENLSKKILIDSKATWLREANSVNGRRIPIKRLSNMSSPLAPWPRSLMRTELSTNNIGRARSRKGNNLPLGKLICKVDEVFRKDRSILHEPKNISVSRSSALHRTVRTEDAAISGFRPKNCVTAFAFIKEHALIRGY